MSLDKAIEHGKEHRKQYQFTDPKSVDYRCRNHGGKTHKDRNPWQCEWCLENRLHKHKRNELKHTDTTDDFTK